MSTPRETVVDLGPESAFTKFPAPITLEEESFFLVHGKKGYLLLSTVCPHQGAKVSNQGKTFMCKDHGWQFEQTQGECVNGPRAHMFAVPVSVLEGHLVADLSEGFE